MMVILNTDRLTLRAIEETDLEAMYKYSKDPEVGPLAGWKPHESLTETMEIMKTIFIRRKNIWAVVLKETGSLIGSIGLMDDNKRAVDDTMMIGYALAKDRWGQGLMTEAVNAVITYGFTGLKLNMISATCYPHNPASKKVLEKNGFVYEGQLRHAEKLYDGSVYDHLCFSVNAAEFNQFHNNSRG